jgi:hypothetical protein
VESNFKVIAVRSVLVAAGRYSDRQGRIKAIKFLRPISFVAQALFLLGYRLEWESVYLLLLVVWGLRGASSAFPEGATLRSLLEQDYLA